MGHLSGHSSSSSIYLFLREHHRKERGKTSEKTSFGSITESLLASSHHRLVSDPTSQYTSSVSPPHLPISPSFSSGAFHAQLLPGEKRRGTRRGDRRRKIFSPTLLPPSAADYRGKLFMCALSSSSSSSSLRSHAATKRGNPPKSKQAHILVGLCG